MELIIQEILEKITSHCEKGLEELIIVNWKFNFHPHGYEMWNLILQINMWILILQDDILLLSITLYSSACLK